MRIVYKLILLSSFVVLLCTIPISFFAIQKSQAIISEKTFEVCTTIAKNIVTITRDELFLDSTYQNTANLVSRLKDSKLKALSNVYIINVYGKYVVDLNNTLVGKYASEKELEYFKKIDKVTLDEINFSQKSILRFSYPVYLDPAKKMRIGMAVLDFDKNILYKPVNDIRYFILILGGGVFTLALFISVFTSVFLTRPLHKLAGGVKEFAEGKLDYRIGITTTDEIGKLADSFNYMANSLEKADKLKQQYITAYQKFVPMEIVTFLEKGTILDVNLGDQVQKEMTVLFSDIRSFTELSETLTPEENFNFINAYLKRMGPIIRKHNGFIDKYIGDAIMALFPYSPNDALDAAIEMQSSLLEYNESRSQKGFREIHVGIGLHTGKLMLGTIGENERMEGTVISDSVNLASRLESLTKLYHSPIIISENTFVKLDDAENYHYRTLGNVKVKGKREDVLIIEIMDYLSQEELEKREKVKDLFDRAILLYYLMDVDDAILLFKEVLGATPNDITMNFYIERCEYLKKYGVESPLY
ncbi:MAG: adenylate/guanylate cyclase domain-containing protein [Leptospiraceae bacterium]|nr:adenylate/guanylate cyclase domain-containing protein [Leptospiraceae bacterium]